MTSNQNTKKPSLAARLKMGLAALALVGVLAGGASAVVDVDIDPVSSADTTEEARSSYRVRDASSYSSRTGMVIGTASARGVSWQ